MISCLCYYLFFSCNVRFSINTDLLLNFFTAIFSTIQSENGTKDMAGLTKDCSASNRLALVCTKVVIIPQRMKHFAYYFVPVLYLYNYKRFGALFMRSLMIAGIVNTGYAVNVKVSYIFEFSTY